ncbi:hypothetical protein PLESTB_001049400 [Pleodorina starrii]|uniref:Small ribosomal subunit protein bS18c n=1 Tax=Pleodorina starrii TaxID=330485 RepID=A0A9W6BPA0_9CHLO|nr:hypothetical protein PLESTB_001049400 [Pleodorina starrii]
MQTNVSRLTGALRALANVGSQQLPLAQAATCLSSTGRVCLGQHEGAPTTPWGQCPSGPSIARNFSASTPNQPDEPASKSESAAGAASARPTFTARLRDLLAVSSWRISKGETGRLADVKDDLATQSTAASLQEALGHGAAQPAAAAAGGEAQDSGGSAAAAPPATAGGGTPEQQLQAQLLQGLQQQQQQEGQGQPEGEQQQQQQPLQPHQRLLHPKYGYAALGGVVPEEGGASTTGGLVGLLTSQNPRVNPRRRFMPGETYEPQDLNPFASRAPGRPRPNAADPVRRPTAEEVMEKADYKNVAFLSRWFLSPAGRLLPRRQTRLPVHVHKYVSRQIKLARHMGLMAGEARLDKLHLARLREQELVEAQRRAAAVTAATAAAVTVTSGGVAAVGGGRGGTRLQDLAELGA